MAKKETDSKVLERTYTIPLRKEYLKVARWRRTEKAVTAVKKFMVRHMKSETIKIGKSLNEELWKHGIKNPPHHVKVNAVKDDKGIVTVNLFGMKEKVKAKKATEKQKAPQANSVPEEGKTEEITPPETTPEKVKKKSTGKNKE